MQLTLAAVAPWLRRILLRAKARRYNPSCGGRLSDKGDKIMSTSHSVKVDSKGSVLETHINLTRNSGERNQ